MTDDTQAMLERFFEHNSHNVNRLRRSRRYRWIFAMSQKLQRLYSEFTKKQSLEEKNAALAAVINAFEEGPVWRSIKWIDCAYDDISVFLHQHGGRKAIDHSEKSKDDYYSVAVIVKNEARYIKEFILFYMVTGADRIYIYDNDSEDNLIEVIKPFTDSGFVVYRRWPGHAVQAAAYRDAIRRVRRRTKWLALIDADEFLFPVEGSMPDQLRKYEKYPGVGVNWILFGPNGHVTRPEGLVMDNYTTVNANYDSVLNWHIKSIVKPRKVFCVYHPHFAVYKGREYAVDENYAVLDNTTTRAFSFHNKRDVFRINHYTTKSLEDLRIKCQRGFPDGSPNADFDNSLRPFDCPLAEDHVIMRYADAVREIYGDY